VCASGIISCSTIPHDVDWTLPDVHWMTGGGVFLTIADLSAHSSGPFLAAIILRLVSACETFHDEPLCLIVSACAMLFLYLVKGEIKRLKGGGGDFP